MAKCPQVEIIELKERFEIVKRRSAVLGQQLYVYGEVKCGCGDRFPFYSCSGQALLAGEVCENCQAKDGVQMTVEEVLVELEPPSDEHFELAARMLSGFTKAGTDNNLLARIVHHAATRGPPE